MEIRPIETEYNGYRFRSRLEARWAVFFDAMGIKYEYEPEGFEMANGTRYLPDFWLPKEDLYVEVKPSVQSRACELCKAVDFVRYSKKEKVMVLSEIPEPNEHEPVWIFPVYYYHPMLENVLTGYKCFCKNVEEPSMKLTQTVFFEKYYKDEPAEVDITEKEMGYGWKNNECWFFNGKGAGVTTEWMRYNKHVTRDTNNAYLAARQARFEHGEKPGVKQ